MMRTLAAGAAGGGGGGGGGGPLLQTRRSFVRVRLKWVKNRGLDHIIDRDTAIKAAVLLKDAILRHPSSAAPVRALAPLKKPLGLTVPVLRFLRRYPTLFSESPHPRFPSLPVFSLAPAALLLHAREQSLYSDDADNLTSTTAAGRLARLLMMCRSRSLPLSSLLNLRYDLGLPPNFPATLPAHTFRLHRRPHDGAPLISLAAHPSHLAVSALHLRNQPALASPDHRNLRRPADSTAAPLAFPMLFPRGYGGMNKVKAWMEDFHRLPYISPYDDFSGIDPESEIMEKRVVGVLHELLSLMLHRKTHRNYIRGLRDELGLPHKFTRVFTRYPGIFYLSLKCKTTTVMLREGYERGKLVEPNALTRLRDKYYYVMRTGILYRGKGASKLVLDDDDLAGRRDIENVIDPKVNEDDGCGGEDEVEEWCEADASGDEGESDEED